MSGHGATAPGDDVTITVQLHKGDLDDPSDSIRAGSVAIWVTDAALLDALPYPFPTSLAVQQPYTSPPISPQIGGTHVMLTSTAVLGRANASQLWRMQHDPWAFSSYTKYRVKPCFGAADEVDTLCTWILP